jgi:hypothetical protein
MALFTLAIIFNLLPASSNTIHRWLDFIFNDDGEIIHGNFKDSNENLLDNEEYICVPKSAVFDHNRFKGMESRTDVGGAGKSGATKTKKSKRPKTKLDKELDKEIKEEIHDGSLEEVIVKRNIVEE